MRWWVWGLAVVAGIGALAVGSFALQAQLPPPTGPYPVGRVGLIWTDTSRPETATADPADTREVHATIWYPAASGTGTATRYFPDFAALGDGLAQSGEVSAIEAFALRFIRSEDRLRADPASAAGGFPLVLFSPGNGTNAEFYAALPTDLASYGYVVVVLNHPYDVAAVALTDGRVAVFNEGPSTDRQPYVGARIAERAADLRFALDRLEELAASGGALASAIDFTRVGALGHSLGGIAAAEACAADPRFRACANLDGIQPGGIFAAARRSLGPAMPFLFLTKEPVLAPALMTLLEERTTATTVVQLVGATHDSFTDGPLLEPRLLPTRGPADAVMDVIRSTVRTFFDQALNGQPVDLPAREGLTVRSFGH